jgi:hypothetical protein
MIASDTAVGFLWLWNGLIATVFAPSSGVRHAGGTRFETVNTFGFGR